MTAADVRAIIAAAEARRQQTMPDYAKLDRVKELAQKWWNACDKMDVPVRPRSKPDPIAESAFEAMLSICEIMGVD